jgi:hypothetical protein
VTLAAFTFLFTLGATCSPHPQPEAQPIAVPIGE